jgi:hypothetical protein
MSGDAVLTSDLFFAAAGTNRSDQRFQVECGRPNDAPPALTVDDTEVCDA